MNHRVDHFDHNNKFLQKTDEQIFSRSLFDNQSDDVKEEEKNTHDKSMFIYSSERRLLL